MDMTALGVSLLIVGAIMVLIEAHVPTLGALGGPGVVVLAVGAVLAVMGPHSRALLQGVSKTDWGPRAFGATRFCVCATRSDPCSPARKALRRRATAFPAAPSSPESRRQSTRAARNYRVG